MPMPALPPEEKARRARERQRRWRDANRDRVTEKTRRWRESHPNWRTDAYEREREYKLAWLNEQRAGGCVQCPEADLDCLDFHHRDATTKEFTVSFGISSRSFARLKAEVAKCVVLCSNCHRKEHARLRRDVNA